jgi:hypothetical protein
VQLGNIPPENPTDGEIPHARQNDAVQQAPIVVHGTGPFVRLRVLLKICIGQLLECPSASFGFESFLFPLLEHGERINAIPYLIGQLDGLSAGRLRRVLT